MSSPVVWKHIGLSGHSVGTLSCQDERLVWKSAIAGNASDDVGLSATTRSIPKAALASAQWTVFGKSGHLRLQTIKKTAENNHNLPHEMRFDGFPANDFSVLKETLQNKYDVELQQHFMSAAGTQYGLTKVKGKNLVFRHCVLDEMTEEGQEFEPRAEEEMMSLDLAQVSQCVLPGNNRNEIEVQFPESDAVEAGTDQLVSIRFYIPPDPDADPADKEASTAAELLQAKIMATANVRKTTGDVIVSFEQSKGTFLTPRGRYTVELYDHFFRLRGQKYDYKIKYDDINRLFLLPKPDEVHMAFVIALDKPIRQGQQRYQYLVLQASKEHDEVTVNLDPETLEKEYGGELQPVMRGSLSNLIAKTFKVITKKKVFIPGKFANANEQACVKCAVRANEGLLYPLEKQFVFIHKPPILIRFNQVESVEFQRYAGGQGSTRNFDLCVNLKASVTGGAGSSSSNRDYTFSGIDRSDYAGLYNFLSGKKIPIKNLQGSGFMEETVQSSRRAPVYNENEIFGGGDDEEDEEGSDDESYDENAPDEDGEGGGGSDDDDSEEDMDDDELGSEVDEDLDSDLEEHRKTATKKKKKAAAPSSSTPKKKKKKRSRDDSDDDDSDEDASPKKAKSKKAKKDKNAPKRGMSAFMFFSNENRAKAKAENPDLSFGEMGKLLGQKWKEIDPEDKKKYEAMAAKDKARYQEEMKSYTPPAGAKGGKGGKAAKKKKDPKAPKRAMTSFFLFSKEMRAKVKADNPGISFGDVGKKIGELFRALSPEEKEKYEKMAKKDKERYKAEMANYSAPPKDDDGDKSDGLDDAADSDDSDDSDDDDSDDE